MVINRSNCHKSLTVGAIDRDSVARRKIKALLLNQVTRRVQQDGRWLEAKEVLEEKPTTAVDDRRVSKIRVLLLEQSAGRLRRGMGWLEGNRR